MVKFKADSPFSRIGFILTIIFFLLCVSIPMNAGDGVPIIRSFDPSEYGASYQNWSITQDWDGYVYVANHSCLIRFNGLSWDCIYPFGENDRSIIRSVFSDNDAKRIYIGAYREFGYLTFDRYGDMEYHSISSGISEEIGRNDSIWSIAEISGHIYFFCFSAIYRYCPDNEQITRIQTRWNSSFRIDDEYWVANNSGAVLSLDPGKGCLSSVFDFNLPSRVILAFHGEGDTIISVTESSGVLEISSNGYKRIDSFGNKWPTANRAIIHSNGDIVIGTIDNGIAALDKSGKVKWHISSEDGLPDDTVLGMFEDREGKIWVAMDKGIAVISLDGSRIIPLPSHLTGKKTALLIDGEDFYIGTNRGLFKFSIDGMEEIQSYDIRKQIWSISQYDSCIFVGGNRNTYTIDGEHFSMISRAAGGTEVRPYTSGGKTILLQGTNSSLRSYCKDNQGKWKMKDEIAGFSEPVVRIEIDYLNNIWAEHRYRGLYRIMLSPNMDSVDSVLYYPNVTGEDPSRVHITKIEGRVVFFNRNGFYTYDDLSHNLVPVPFLNENAFECCKSESITEVAGHYYWALCRDCAIKMHCETDNVRITDFVDFGSFSQSIPDQWGCVAAYSDATVFTTEEGLLLYRKEEKAGSPEIGILSFHSSSNGKEERQVIDGSTVSLSRGSDICIKLGCSDASFGGYEVSYYLKGYDNIWKDYHPDRGIEFQNLPHGDLTLIARLNDKFGVELDRIELPIHIRPHFLLSGFMIVVYVLIGISLVCGGVFGVRMIMRRQRKKFEIEKSKALKDEEERHQRETLELKNNQLEQSLLIKSQELAAYSLLEANRNDVLTKLTKALNAMRYTDKPGISKRDYDELSEIIRNGTFTKADWNKFYDNFDLIHKSFFHNLKSNYEDLSNNDLRLCAYLRLNMSTKEIASVLGIAPKSVDQAKYRLRKKLDIDSSTTLESFLLNFNRL